MGRKRLTQFFPGLLPLRKRQKIFCYYMGMRLDHNRYSETHSDITLSHPLFHASWPLYNYKTGYELTYQENKAYNCKLAAKVLDNLSSPPAKHFPFGTLYGAQIGKRPIKMDMFCPMDGSSFCRGAGCAK